MILSSSRSAETIFLLFIVTAQRGNDTLIICYRADTVPRCWVVFTIRIIYYAFTYAKAISSITVIRSYRSSSYFTTFQAMGNYADWPNKSYKKIQREFSLQRLYAICHVV